MAKKRIQSNEEQQRQSRKEILLARKQQRQTRQIRLAVLGVVALLAIVLIIGLVNELLLKPSSPVAQVNNVELLMKDWQKRVRLQRAQLIIGIEDLAETFGQDIGQVQQFAGQQINLLEDPVTLGQLVLDQLIDEELVRQAAEARGISVSESDIQKEIEESFNYFSGNSPTPLPTATETPFPTPSLTPISSGVITTPVQTETPQSTPTIGPTSTPLPTATPVSLESFQESFSETISQFQQYGIDEADFREIVRAQIYEEHLREALAEEEELSQEAEHASFFYIGFESEDEAQDALTKIANSEFLSVWNEIKSSPPDENSASTAVASEILWRTEDDVQNLFGNEVAQAVFELGLNEPSGVIVLPAQGEDGLDRYLIVMVSGKEIRPLSEAALQNAKEELLTAWLEGQRQSEVEIFERWRGSVPRRPILDRRFLLPPTPAPPTPTFDLPAIEETPANPTSE